MWWMAVLRTVKEELAGRGVEFYLWGGEAHGNWPGEIGNVPAHWTEEG